MAEPLGVSVDDGVCVSLALCVALGEIVPDGVSEVDGVEVMLPLWVCEADGVREELCVGDGVVDTDADSDGDCVAVPGQVRRTEREGGDAWAPPPSTSHPPDNVCESVCDNDAVCVSV